MVTLFVQTTVNKLQDPDFAGRNQVFKTLADLVSLTCSVCSHVQYVNKTRQHLEYPKRCRNVRLSNNQTVPEEEEEEEEINKEEIMFY